jgi:uncharacterized phage protein (TIGR01671 family)
MKKFRGWKKSTKEMYYPKQNVKLSKGVYISKSGKQEYLSNILYERDYICTEYIGMKDDDGQDIYYSDIVSFEIMDENQTIKGTALVWLYDNKPCLHFNIESVDGNEIEVFYSNPIFLEDKIELKNVVSIKVIGNTFENNNGQKQ